ncbi:hypothetical protein L9F63_014561, partial [Diploptera punctata]
TKHRNVKRVKRPMLEKIHSQKNKKEKLMNFETPTNPEIHRSADRRKKKTAKKRLTP